MDESKVIPTLIVPPKHDINHRLVDAKFVKTLYAVNEETDLAIKQLLPEAKDTQVRSKIYLLEIKRMETACHRLLDIEIEVWCKLQGNPLTKSFLETLLKERIEPMIDHSGRGVCDRLKSLNLYTPDEFLQLRKAVDERVGTLKHAMGLEAQIRYGEYWARQNAQARKGVSQPDLSEPGLATGSERKQEAPRLPTQTWDFRKKDKTWRIGQCDFQELKGFHYISELLGHPGEWIDCVELLKITDPEFRNLPPQLDLGEAADPAAIQQCKARLEEICQEREEANLRLDSVAIEQLDEETEAIASHFKTTQGLGGRPRRLGNQNNRFRDRVSVAIKRAIRGIAEDELKIAQHLQESIRLGYAPQYGPVGVVPDWNLT